MNYADARRAIESWVAQNWTETPVIYDNDDADKPDDAPWVRCSIFNATGGQINIGGPPRRYRFNGFVIFGIFVVENTGPGEVTELADDAVALFEGNTLGASPGVKFENVFAQEQGADPEGPWFRTDVQADFRFDAIR